MTNPVFRFAKISTAVASLGLALASAPALADSVSFGGDGALGDYSGTMSFEGGLLTVELTNLPTTAPGGTLNGFAFNFNSDISSIGLVDWTGKSTATLSDDVFSGSFATMLHDSVNAQPYGLFDVGIGSGPNFQGNGGSTGALAIGSSGSWTFAVSGADSVYDFWVASTAKGKAGQTADFVARFAQFSNGGSDKVPGVLVPSPIPEPSTYALMLAGLGVVGFMARRRRLQD